MEKRIYKWFYLKDIVPPEGIQILFCTFSGKYFVGVVETEHPSYEDSFKKYQYIESAGDEVEWHDVKCWSHIPEPLNEVEEDNIYNEE